MASGYLIATRFELLYDAALRSGRYDNNPNTTEPIYGVPHKSRAILPPNFPRYRGINRDPLRALSYEEAKLFTEAGTPSVASEATAVLDKIELSTGREDGWVTSANDIECVWNALGGGRKKYEVIFGKEFGDPALPPKGALFLGCDAAYFCSDHFSCICDALFIPIWHGTDPEGMLFRDHFFKLNEHGLFDSNEQALDYLHYYLSFDWTERDDNFTSIEIYSVTL
jgi:hypothetical protein